MSMLAAHAQFQSPDRAENARAAAKKLGGELAGIRPSQVAYFAGRNYEHAVLAAAMRDAFPGAATFGCSSGGELANELMLHDAVTAMAFGPGTFDFFAAAIIPRLAADGRPTDIREAVPAALAGFEKRLGRKISALDYSQYVGLVLADGIKYFIEPVVDRISDLTTIPFIGGLAADDGEFRNTPVYLDGRAVNDAALLALLKPSGKFGLLKTQGLELSSTVFTVTKADESARVVNEFDGRPAALAYAEAIGMRAEDLTLANAGGVWPLALMIEDEPFLRVILGGLPDGSLQFAHSLGEGMRLKLSRTTDIIESTAKTLAAKRAELGGISGALHFNCMMRHQRLETDGEAEKFGRLFHGFPHAGPASHGEIYIAVANQTSTMLLFA